MRIRVNEALYRIFIVYTHITSSLALLNGDQPITLKTWKSRCHENPIKISFKGVSLHIFVSKILHRIAASDNNVLCDKVVLTAVGIRVVFFESFKTRKR